MRPAIPDKFFMIVVDEDKQTGGPAQRYALAVVMGQEVKGAHPLREFATTVRRVEAESHLDFFPKLKKAEQDELETEEADESWGLDAEVMSGHD
jgi:DNA/RNA endonuclease G (NUC1)